MTDMPASSRPKNWLDALLHPVPLVMLLVLLVNDHILKVHHPGWLSGKLSDVAALVLLPLVLLALADLAAMASPRIPAPGRRAVVGSVLLTAAIFTAMQATPLGAEAYRWGLAAAQWPFHAIAPAFLGEPIPPLSPVHLTPDLSDLLTLPAAAVASLRFPGSLPRHASSERTCLTGCLAWVLQRRTYGQGLPARAADRVLPVPLTPLRRSTQTPPVEPSQRSDDEGQKQDPRPPGAGESHE